MDSSYCYPGTSVLKNLRGIKDPELLATYERAATVLRGRTLPSGQLDFDHLKAIHHRLFQDVYPWAGQTRTVDISKGNSLFCRARFIDKETANLMLALRAEEHLSAYRDPETFARRAAHFLCELNAIHPFREGNGRTQRVFFGLVAEQAGYQLDLTRISESAMLEASIAGMQGREEPMATVVEAALVPTRQRTDQQQALYEQALATLKERQTARGRGDDDLLR